MVQGQNRSVPAIRTAPNHRDRFGASRSRLHQLDGGDVDGGEQLVAEFAAAFWCAHFRLELVTRTDHATYLDDWLTPLRQDPRALVAACGHAERAVDYLNRAAGWTLDDAGTIEPAE